MEVECLMVYHSIDRVKGLSISAEIFHCKPINPYVAAVFVGSNVVLYIDSLDPGSEPLEEVRKQIEASFDLDLKYSIKSVLCQKQKLSDCLVFAAAHLDALLSGEDLSRIRFNQKTLRSYLVRSILGKTLHFPFSRCKNRGEVKVNSKNRQ